MELTVRNATIHDLKTLQCWDTKEHIIASDPNDDWNWETELMRQPDWREQLIAEVNGVPIGFIQIIDPQREQSKYWGEVPPNLRAVDIWIGEKENLGKGFGTIMMKLALKKCFSDDNVTAVILDPLETNTRAHKFYEKLGFRFIEKRTFGEDVCFVYRLEKKEWIGA